MGHTAGNWTTAAQPARARLFGRLPCGWCGQCVRRRLWASWKIPTPASSTATITKPCVDTAGAGAALLHVPTRSVRSHASSGPSHSSLQQTPCAQKPEAHSVGALHDCPRPMNVGVAVGVAVAVSVGVGVLVAVGVGVGLASTHVPGQKIAAAPPLPPGATSPVQPVTLFGSHTKGELHGRTPFGGQHGSPRSPQPLVALARPAANKSTTTTASPTRVTAGVYEIDR